MTERPAASSAPIIARPLGILVVCRDSSLLSGIAELAELTVSARVVESGYVAMRVLCNERIDVLVFELTADGEGQDLLDFLAGSHSAPLTVVIAEAGGAKALSESGRGAIVLEKPLRPGDLATALRSHCENLLSEKRETWRVPLHVPVTLMLGAGQYVAASIDLNETGVGVRLPHPLPLKEVVELSFVLPGSREAIRARGEISRIDHWGNAGIHIFSMSLRARAEITAWMNQNRTNVQPKSGE